MTGACATPASSRPGRSDTAWAASWSDSGCPRTSRSDPRRLLGSDPGPRDEALGVGGGEVLERQVPDEVPQVPRPGDHRGLAPREQEPRRLRGLGQELLAQPAVEDPHQVVGVHRDHRAPGRSRPRTAVARRSRSAPTVPACRVILRAPGRGRHPGAALRRGELPEALRDEGGGVGRFAARACGPDLDRRPARGGRPRAAPAPPRLRQPAQPAGGCRRPRCRSAARSRRDPLPPPARRRAARGRHAEASRWAPRRGEVPRSHPRVRSTPTRDSGCADRSATTTRALPAPS